jgi:hypothetical protein
LPAVSKTMASRLSRVTTRFIEAAYAKEAPRSRRHTRRTARVPATRGPFLLRNHG